MQSRPQVQSELTSEFFVVPGANLQQGSQDYLTAVKLTKAQLRQRWETSTGQNIITRWRANNFDRQVIESLVGQIYDHVDLRGINLVQAELRQADLSNVELYSANLEGANLQGADLTNSYLSEANIKGTNFDWAKMERVYLDGVDFNSQTSFIGVNLSVINFTLAALVQDLAVGQARIVNLERKRPLLAALLRITCDYGRSFRRFLFWCLIVILTFAFACFFLKGSVVKTALLSGSDPRINLWDSLYFSAMTFLTIGTEIQPASPLGRVLAVAEGAIGYLMTGLLVTVLIRRTIGD
ncbi:pentapeptide repeat-containing protein [Trichocoleus desertorum AS-A10]|uniref:pentapeptide repeat-containing protein n=1 Tax=Trichocoleus desertorum TaxID=1481672 RepID=UPI003297317D